MSRFEPELLDEIRARIDIVDVIGRQVALKPAGKNYVGLCPFHQEKTPSFHVHRERQFFHCFGCKESGDVFAFVMKYEGLSFPEAVQRLAAEAGVALPQSRADSPEEAERRRKRERYLLAHALAAKFYHQMLGSPAARAAANYLQRRGIRGEVIHRFKLGFSPNRWDELLKYLAAHGISAQEAVSAGLAVQRDEKKPFDLFRNRLMFPIEDARGRVIGFGGRTLYDETPKYINTPQTELFSKREHLYGLAQARTAARREGVLIVCEGYTDVLALAQCGIENSVASLGTAFTAEQARTLRRFAQEVVLAFDADAAGRSATDRGLDLLAETGLTVRVAMLPEGEDPDSFIRRRGKEAFLHLVAEALPLTEYKLEEVLRSADLVTVDGRARAVEQIVPIIASVESAVAREGYVQRVSRRVGSSPQAILAELERFFRTRGRQTHGRHRIERSRYTTIDPSRGPRAPDTSTTAPLRKSAVQVGSPPSYITDERTVLWKILHEPELIDRLVACLGKRPFQLDRHNAMFQALVNERSGGTSAAEKLSPDIDAALEDLRSWEPAVVLEIDVYIDRLWTQQMRGKLRRLEVELTRLPERDEDAYARRVGSLLLAYKDLRQAVRRRGTATG